MRRYLLPLGLLFFPLAVSAHEVYVLSPQQIAYALGIPPFNMWQVVLENLHQFLFWAFIAFIVVSTMFCASIFRIFERAVDPLLDTLKRYAPLVCRLTVGIGLLAGAYYQATYGPELPLAPAFGAFTPFVTALMLVIGACLVIGIWVRAASAGALALFGVSIYFHGIYMFTYANYFGEFLVLLLAGVGSARKGSGRLDEFWHRIERAVRPFEFAIIRFCFGLSFLYAALYAKILHNNLALMVAELPLAGHPYGVAHYLGFEPHFLVLGAAIIEVVIACFFMFGIEIRWTCIFLEFWLALSLWWFGEAVWPHIILIGLPIAIFMHGYDRYSAEGFFFKQRRLEPVL